ncbi:MAG: MaoC family dehydratase [Solirubrobacteraceae bacterium]
MRPRAQTQHDLRDCRATVTGTVTDLAALPELVDTDLGATDWKTMTQERVDAFADVTEDHQFIHVDPERAAQTPFGGTIAHGYLTLALVAPIMFELLSVSDAAMGVNYGLNRVRFPAPLRVGSDYRGTARMITVEPIEGGVQGIVAVTIEVRDQPKPALVAECVFRFYA